MKVILIALLGATSAVMLKNRDCGCEPVEVCRAPEYKLKMCNSNIGNIMAADQKAGYGEIKTRSVEQEQAAAEAKNQYDHEESNAQWSGNQAECDTNQGAAESQGSLTEVLNVCGEYDAEE